MWPSVSRTPTPLRDAHCATGCASVGHPLRPMPETGSVALCPARRPIAAVAVAEDLEVDVLAAAPDTHDQRRVNVADRGDIAARPVLVLGLDERDVALWELVVDDAPNAR